MNSTMDAVILSRIRPAGAWKLKVRVSSRNKCLLIGNEKIKMGHYTNPAAGTRRREEPRLNKLSDTGTCQGCCSYLPHHFLFDPCEICTAVTKGELSLQC